MQQAAPATQHAPAAAANAGTEVANIATAADRDFSNLAFI
jgi:hypothetical protein